VVTHVGTSGDLHYTSCTNPGKLFLEMSSECSSWLAKGMSWRQTELNYVFLHTHIFRFAVS